jgi:hypothetical protein
MCESDRLRSPVMLRLVGRLKENFPPKIETGSSPETLVSTRSDMLYIVLAYLKVVPSAAVHELQRCFQLPKFLQKSLSCGLFRTAVLTF